MTGPADADRTVSFQEHLRAGHDRSVRNLRDHVVPIATAALERLECHPHLHEAVDARDTDRLAAGKCHLHPFGQIVGHLPLDADSFADVTVEIFERESLARQRQPLQGVIDRRLVELHAHMRIGRRPWPGRVGGDLRIGGQAKPERG